MNKGTAIESLKCSDKTKENLAQYAMGIASILRDNLFGIYLCGSLARGCYHPATSDIDIVVITRDINSESNIFPILQVHEKADAAIDAVFLTENQMSVDEFPATVDFLVKPISGYRIIRPADGDRDLLLQRQDVYEAGVALIGPTPQMAVRPVPWALLMKSFDFLFPNIIPHFKNPVLMLCRIAYAYEHRMLSSKCEAGRWAAKAFDGDWESVIQAALDEYMNGVAQTLIPRATLIAFEEYCAQYIEGRCM